MNYDSYPSNVDFGNPNAPVTNQVGYQTIPQNTTPLIQQQTIPTQSQTQQQKKSVSFYEKIMSIFNNKTGTILSTAIGMAIGFAFKDLVNATVNNLLAPLIILLLSYSTYLSDYLNLTSYITQQKATLSISGFISNLVSFTLTIIAVYYASLLITDGI
jgi:large-conductance mechanosensitive channel